MAAEAVWTPLAAELDRWAAAGDVATFWWRDDDAAGATPALDSLLDLAAAADAPVALAVIPQAADGGLTARLAAAAAVTVLQHGYAHANHAPAGEKKIELGPHRRADHVVAEIGLGQQRLQSLFGDRFLPVMVPPWNRIAPYLVPMLPEMQFTGLSAFGPRARAEPVRGFRQTNTHADLIDWRGSRGFVGPAAAVAQIAAHLAARRTGAADRHEATGILTHHLVQDGGSWAFLADLFARLAAHPAARMCAARELFGGAR